MKTKLIFLVMLVALVFLITSCGNSQPTQPNRDYSNNQPSYNPPSQPSEPKCFTALLSGESEALLKYCKDATGTYTERIYCDGDYHLYDHYFCQSNRCVKNTDRTKCVNGATCTPYGNTVTCVRK